MSSGAVGVHHGTEPAQSEKIQNSRLSLPENRDYLPLFHWCELSNFFRLFSYKWHPFNSSFSFSLHLVHESPNFLESNHSSPLSTASARRRSIPYHNACPTHHVGNRAKQQAAKFKLVTIRNRNESPLLRLPGELSEMAYGYALSESEGLFFQDSLDAVPRLYPKTEPGPHHKGHR
jgi:hypothetical protein